MDNQLLNLTELVLTEVRRDTGWKPPLVLLYEIGDKFKEVPINHPLRSWWGAHRFEYLCGIEDPEKRNLINCRLLWNVGETAGDEIDLDF